MASDGINIYVLVLETGITRLKKLNWAGVMINEATMSTAYRKMSVTHDYSKALVWNNVSQVKIYDLASMTLVGFHNPAITPAAWMTQKITISADSSMAIIETGVYNPIVIINLNTCVVEYQITAMAGTLACYFLNNKNI